MIVEIKVKQLSHKAVNFVTNISENNRKTIMSDKLSSSEKNEVLLKTVFVVVLTFTLHYVLFRTTCGLNKSYVLQIQLHARQFDNNLMMQLLRWCVYSAASHVLPVNFSVQLRQSVTKHEAMPVTMSRKL